MQIYFVTINLHEQVHCMGGLGFTKQFYKYAYASTSEEAQRAVALWAEEKGCNVKNVVAAVAHNQKPGSYTFPEQILNLPQGILDGIYAERDYPAEWRTPGQNVALVS